MLRIQDVSKGYWTKDHEWHQVLDGVNLELDKGESIGILGRNGAGKSTLFKLISGLEMPDKGKITRDKEKISWPVGGASGIHNALSGEDNIKFISRIHDLDYKEILDFVEDFAELGKYMRMPISTYSGGMRGRLAFGICMALQFDVYLIDEGFSPGDARFRKRSKTMFQEYSKNSSMLIVSHNKKTIRELCTKAGVLANGKLTLYDNVNEAIKVYSGL